MHWIPVAGDGCGNSYILDASRSYIDSDAVFFVDTMESVDKVSYVAGSGLPYFLTFLLRGDHLCVMGTFAPQTLTAARG